MTTPVTGSAPDPVFSGSFSHRAVDAVVRDSARRMGGAGIDHAENEAVALLADAAGCDAQRIRRARIMGETLEQVADDPTQVAKRFERGVMRRCAREPLQYILGTAPFRYLDLAVGPGVFIPRPETELIVDIALHWLADAPLSAPRAADLCAGSGAIGLALATERTDAQVWAVEKSPDALAWARRNMARCGFAQDEDGAGAGTGNADIARGFAQDRDGAGNDTARRTAGTAPRYTLIHGDATAPETLADLDGTLDMVLTNPPYVPTSTPPDQPEVRDWDPPAALYGASADGTAIPRAILRRARALLRPGGLLVMEHDATQGPALRAAAETLGYVQTRTARDYTGRDRFLIAHAPA